MANTIELSQGGIDKLNQSVDKLIKSMTGLEASVNRLATNNASAFQRVFGTTNDLNNIIKAINQLKVDGGSAFTSIAKSLKTLIAEINKLPTGTDARFQVIENIVDTINDTGNIDVNKVATIQAVGNAVRTLTSTLAGADFTKLTNARTKDFAKVVSDMVTTLIELPAVVNSLPGIGSLEIISKVFAALGGGLSTMKNAAAKISNQDIKKLAVIFGGLTTTFKLISALTSNLPGGTQLSELSKVIQKLGSGLASLATVSRTVNTKVVSSLTAVFVKLVASFKLMALVLSLIPGGKALSEFANTINNLGNGLRSLANLGRDVRLDVNLFSAVQDFIKLLKPFFTSLKAFRGTDLPDFGKILPPIFATFEQLAGRKLGRVDVRPLKEFMAGLAESLNSFGRVKVDAGKLNSVASLLKSLFDGAGKFSQQSGNNLGANFGDSITQGFVKGLRIDRAVQFVFTNIGRIIAEFNPVVLFTKLTDGLRSFVDGAIAKVKELGSNLSTVGSTLSNFGTNLFNTLGLGGVTKSGAFQLAQDFDALTTQVAVFGNLTSEQTKKAQAFANEIGIKYPQSANDAMVGILNLQKAGLDLNQVFDALPSAADLASVSDTKDLDAASRAIIQVTQSFREFGPGITAAYDNASVAADILARSANLSTASVESLVQGLGNVGPIATNFGMDLQETTAILALFQDRGIQGAEGGTQLKSMLTQLTSGSAESRKALKALGVSITDDHGRFKDINTIVNELNTSMNKTRTVTVNTSHLTAEQAKRLKEAEKAYASVTRQILVYQDGLSTGSLDTDKAGKKVGELTRVQENAAKVIAELTGSQQSTEKITKEITRTQADNAKAIKALAGSYGQAGLSVLLNAGDDAIRNFIEATGRLPSAAEQASLLLDNLAGDAEQLKGSFETLMVRGMLPLIGRAFRPLVQLGRVVVDFFNSLPDAVFDVASNVILLVSGLASLVAGLTVTSGLALQFTGAIVSGAGFLLSMATNMGLVIAGAATLAASFATLVVVGGAIAAVVTAAASGISYFFSLVENNVGGAGDAFNGLKDSISGIFDTVGDILRTGGDIISFIIGDGFTSANVERGQQLANFFTRISTSLAGIRNNLTAVQTFVSTFRDFLSLNTGTDARDTFISQLVGQGVALDDAIELAAGQVDNLSNRVQAMAGIVGQGWLIQSIFGRSLTGQEVLDLFGSVRSGLNSIADAAVDVFKGLGGLLLSSIGLDSSPAAKQALEQGLSVFGTLITEGLQRLTGIDLTSSLLEFKNGDVAAGAKNLISSLLSNLKTSLLGNKQKITGILSSVFNLLLPGSTFGPRILRALGLSELADGMQQVFDTINKVFRAGVGTLFDVLSGVSLEEALIGNFGPGIRPVITAIQAFGRAISKIATLLGTLFKTIFPSGNENGPSFIESFFTGLTGLFDTVGDIAGILTPAINQIGKFGRYLIRLATANQVLTKVSAILATFVGGLTALTIASKGAIGLNTLTGIFKTLLGVVTPLIVPLLAIGAAALGIKSFFEALVEGGDIVAVLKNTLGNFVSTLASLVGLNISSSQVVGFIDNLGTQLAQLATVIPQALSDLGNLLGAPFLNTLAEGLRTGDFQPVVDSVVDGIKAAFDSATTALFNLGTSLSAPLLQEIANAFKTGDFQPVLNEIRDGLKRAFDAAPQIIIEIGNALSAPLITQIGASLRTGDFNPVFSMLSEGIRTGIIGAGGYIAEIGTAIHAPLITKLGNAMRTGDYNPFFQAIVDGINAARNAIPALFFSLGDTFGVPTLKALADGLRRGDVGEILNAIVDTVVKAAQAAVGQIPTKLKELGQTLNLNFLTDFAVSLEQSLALKILLDALTGFLTTATSIATDTIGGLFDIIRGIKEAVTGENKQAAENIRELAGAIFIFGAGMAILNGPAIVAFLGGLATSLGTLLTTVGAGLLKFAGIAAVLIVLKDAIKGLGEIFSGEKDLGTAIGDFFFNIGADALKLFGLDKIFGIDLSSIKQTWNTVFDSLREIAEVTFGRIQDFFRNIIDGIQIRLALLQAQVDIANPDQAARTKSGALFALNDIIGTGNLTDTFQAIQGALDVGFNESIVKAAARLNFAPLDEKFLANINNLQELSQRDFDGLIAGLASADRLDEAIKKIPPGQLLPFMQRLLTVDPATLQLLDFSQVSGVLEAAVANGSISIDVARAFVMKIPDTVLTPAQKEEFLATLMKDLGLGPDGKPAQGTGTGVPVDVTVDPKATVTEDGKQKFQDDTKALLTDGQPTDTTPIQQDVPVEGVPQLQAAGINTAADAQLMADNLALVKEQADVTAPSLAALTFASTVLSGILNTLVNTSLGSVNTGIERVRTSAQTLAAELPGRMLAIGGAFVVGSIIAANALTPLINKLNEVKTKIDEVAGALAALRDGGVNTNPGTPGTGISVDGKRKDGGSVFAGKLYEVAEQGISELLQIGGKTFLIPGQNGTVVPPVAPPVAGARGGNSVVNTSNADNSIGSIQIIIEGGTNLTTEQLQAATTKGLEDYQRSRPLNRRLALAGKT